MVLDAVANFVRGNTDAAVDNSQTTISVVDASIFPDPSVQGEYNVVIWDAATYPRPDQDPDTEILRVTAIDTTNDDLTVVRAQETTTAAAHPDGSAIHLSPTAKMFSDIESTFGDFWDAGTQELTADVNNPSVSTDVLGINNYGQAEFIDEVVESTSSPSITLPDLSNFIKVVIDCQHLRVPSGNACELVVDGSDTDGRYGRLTNNGAVDNTQNTFELFNNISGAVSIYNPTITLTNNPTEDSTGINISPSFGTDTSIGRAENDDYAIAGSYDAVAASSFTIRGLDATVENRMIAYGVRK